MFGETEAPSSVGDDGARWIDKLQRRQSSPQSRNLHPRFQHLTLPRSAAQLWLWQVPYGKWMRADGREYLFNRWHCVLFERDGPDQAARPADPFQWVCWTAQEHFCWRPAEMTVRVANSILRAWRLPLLPPRRSC